MKTPFITAVLVAAVQGVIVDKSRSQWLADNAGHGAASHGSYIPEPHESIAVPTGNTGPRELPPVNSGEVFYEG